jgi:serine/threonine-protein kinase RsbW
MRTSTCDELRPQAADEGAAELGFEWTYRQANVRRLEDVTALLNDVLATLTGLNYSPTDCLGIRLALGEALVNGLRHGNRCDPAKCVRVCYWVSPAALLAEVEDEGTGFDPAAVPDPTTPSNLDRPGGRGLYLMRHYTTWLRYNDRGNCLTLCARRRR